MSLTTVVLVTPGTNLDDQSWTSFDEPLVFRVIEVKGRGELVQNGTLTARRDRAQTRPRVAP